MLYSCCLTCILNSIIEKIKCGKKSASKIEIRIKRKENHIGTRGYGNKNFYIFKKMECS